MREGYRLTFVLGDLHGAANSGGQQLEVLLRALVHTDVVRIRRSGSPQVRSSGGSPDERIPGRAEVQPTGYRPPGQEEWLDRASIQILGRGDDLDLACVRVADLIVQGVPARVVPELSPPADPRTSGYADQRFWRPVARTPAGPLSVGRWRPMPDRMRITFLLDLFNGPGQDEMLTEQTLTILLEALTEIDVNFLRAHPETPLLYTLRDQILYMEEPTGQEDWQDVPTCIRMGFCDCEDLACWRAGEARVRQNTPARAVPTKHQLPDDGGILYHITTEIAGRPKEDASRFLGMR